MRTCGEHLSSHIYGQISKPYLLKERLFHPYISNSSDWKLCCYGAYMLGIVVAAEEEPLASQGGDLNSSDSVVTRGLEA